MANRAELSQADVSYVADVTDERRPLRLVLQKGVEGWWCNAIYPDTKESIMLGPDFETLHGAKAYAEDWARLVHRVTEPFNWSTGTPHQEFESAD